MGDSDEVIEKIQQEIKELEEQYAITSSKRKTLERMMKLINKEVSEAEFLIHKTRSTLGMPQIELPTVSYNAYFTEEQKMMSGVTATESQGDRRSGICATIEPYKSLVEDIPSLRVMPLDESLIDVPVRKISGPVDPYTISNPLCEVIDTVVAARTVSTYPMIPSSGTKVNTFQIHIQIQFSNHFLNEFIFNSYLIFLLTFTFSFQFSKVYSKIRNHYSKVNISISKLFFCSPKKIFFPLYNFSISHYFSTI